MKEKKPSLLGSILSGKVSLRLFQNTPLSVRRDVFRTCGFEGHILDTLLGDFVKKKLRGKLVVRGKHEDVDATELLSSMDSVASSECTATRGHPSW